MPIDLSDRAGVATLSSVAASTSSVAIAAANNDRKGLLVLNDSSAIMYLAYGATASTTSYSTQIAPAGYWEMPPPPLYGGPLSAVWANAAGAARVTELT